MNNNTRKLIIKIAGIIGSTAAAMAVILFSGIKNIPGLILLATLAGTAGNLVFTGLFTLLLRLEKHLTRANPGDVIAAFSKLPVEDTLTSSAGGKGKTLAKLYQAGYPVPDGCILLPAAFVEDGLRPEVWKQVKNQLTRLRAGKQIPFAVRSSALQEDSANASFAGEFESVLDVRSDEEIQKALRAVLKSRFSERVHSYNQAQGLDKSEHPIAVIIQKMVQPDYAGVLFTVDPLTGKLDQMTGNFVTGTGEKLVSGQVTASTFTMDRPLGTYHGPAELNSISKSLHQLANNIENDLGSPQDIEWAASGGKVFILQARPITTLNGYDPIKAVWNDTLKGRYLWSATNLMEANPEVLTPFTASLRSYLDQRGGPNMTVKNTSLNGIIGGRFYSNITVQVSALSSMFKGDTHRAYRELAGWWGDIPDEMEIPVIPLTKQEWQRQVLPGLWKSTRQFARYRKQAPKFLEESRSVCKEMCDRIHRETSKTSLAALWNDEIFPYYRHSLFHVVSASSNLQIPLEQDLRNLAGAEDATTLLSNLSGSSAQLESMGPMIGLGLVQRGEMSHEEYLNRYGHRGVNEGEVAWPRPMEDPDWLDRQLAEWDRNPVDIDAMLTRQRTAYDAAWDRFCRQHPDKVKVIQKRIQKVSKAAQQREIIRSEATRGMIVMRAFALRAGEMLGVGEDIFFFTIDEVVEALTGDTSLTALQYLPTRKETFQHYCTLPPYPALICGRFDPFAWAADPSRRSDLYDARTQSTPTISDEKDANILHGFAGALGIVEGTVHRLDSLDDSGQFQAGEVLVTTMTNIGWTPIFPRAAAIITDLGAPLSHAAIVARELGIPAVVGCGDATMRLKTGDRVRVDGGKGLVQIL